MAVAVVLDKFFRSATNCIEGDLNKGLLLFLLAVNESTADECVLSYPLSQRRDNKIGSAKKG